MNHVAMQHTNCRECNLVADDGPVTILVAKPRTVSEWRVFEVEVLCGTSFNGLGNCLPREAAMACADDPGFDVVFVEWML